MTEPILKLRSDKYWELKRAYDQQSLILANKDAELADKDAKLADKDAILEEYKRLYGELMTVSDTTNFDSK